MRHRMDSRTLGRYGSHRMAMLSNMAASLFLEESINTTVMIKFLLLIKHPPVDFVLFGIWTQ